MYIEGADVIHMVDDAAYFSAAQFVGHLKTVSVWETILTLWATVHTGLPNTLVFDEGTLFRDTFVGIFEIHDIEYQKSGAQHHSALGIGGRYHKHI